MVTRIDSVREQIRIAAGEPLSYRQADVRLRGCAMQVRINAEDPWNRSLPSPGRLRLFRTPGGPNVRVDTYAYSGCDVPARYDPLLAKLVVWGSDRDECIWRMRRALGEFAISGIQTNLPLFQRILDDEDFVRGQYTTEFCQRPLLTPRASESDLRDMAAAAAIAYAIRNLSFRPTTPERVNTGWHRDSRKLPQ
jgi:acetyl/propionyl-CoA carboxylase alpha subunit